MALIKKQIFRPSKDENLQQFLAKDGAEMKWGMPGDRTQPNVLARKEGKIRKPQKAVQSEPKSPWDDESDALDQGSDNSNSADDTTGKQIKLAVEDAWIEKRGPVDTLTGGRVRFETNPNKKLKPQESKGGFEVQVNRFKNQPSPDAAARTKAAGLVHPDTSKAVQDGVRDAWFEKGDVVPFESKDDKEKRDTKEHARRSAYNYIAANPEMFPDHHKNTDFSKPYDPKTDPKLQQGTKKKDTTPDPNKVSEAEKYFSDRI